MIDPPGRRRQKGRFGGLWQFGGFRGVGTRDWAARVSLRGERGCASEPVAREHAREGVPVEGVGGAEAVRRGAKSRAILGEIGPRFYPRFFVTVRGRMKV